MQNLIVKLLMFSNVIYYFINNRTNAKIQIEDWNTSTLVILKAHIS